MEVKEEEEEEDDGGIRSKKDGDVDVIGSLMTQSLLQRGCRSVTKRMRSVKTWNNRQFISTYYRVHLLHSISCLFS